MNALTVDDMDFEQYLHDHEEQGFADKVRPLADFGEAAWDRINTGFSVTGEPLPWQKTVDKFRFRPSELTIWAGVNGNGKSLVMGQVGIWLQTPVLIASLEMPCDATTARIVRQGSGLQHPSRDYFQRVLDDLSGHLYLYDHIGTVKPDAIFGLIHYASEELKVGHVMIDSLVKCGLGVENYDAQARFVDKLAQIAKEHGIHIHLVHHIRKGASESTIPDKFAIKGAGEITDLADNVLIVSRNGAKEENRRMGQAVDEESPDGFIRVAKQRHGEWEGMWGFWWHPGAMQWMENQRANPARFLA